MKTAIIRGKYLNRFEMQNYEPIAERAGITAFASLKPLHDKFNFPVKKLYSPMDLPDFPKKISILNRLYIDSLHLPNLEKQLKGFDIAHVRELYFRITQQGIIAKEKGYVKKVLCTCSETIPFNHEGIRGRKAFKQNAIRKTDHFHTLTDKAKQCLIKEGVPADKITTIGYGVDRARFRPLPGARSEINALSLLFVGRLEPEKGVLDLIDIFRIMVREYGHCHLNIIGKGSLEKELKKRIIEHSLLRSVALTTVAYDKMPLEYQKADIFILPSRKTKHWEEYYGMSLIEAMSCGMAVVTTDCGAIPEVTGGKAIIVPQDDRSQLYQAIKALANDISLRNKYKEEAYSWAKNHFDAITQSEKIYQLYQTLLTG